MDTKSVNLSLIRQPTAWIPIVMSLAALALVVGHAVIYGIVHEADEGAAAHIFQILMVFQLPFIVYFAIRWLPRKPKQSLQVLVLHILAGLAALASVYFLT
jgi:hypothetical protein